MLYLTPTTFRQNLKNWLDQIKSNNEIAIITRTNDNFYVMSEEDYNGLNETLHLLSSKANRDSLFNSIEEIERGETVSYSLDQL
jgi:Antitoxin of toxin-antitoxin stability system